ncbi:MAG: hypothetical protein JRG80_13095 [Deltaproteobacteria bacterium]|nr:hypothetical protein [Deltaproteobacteria bacterium]MBW2666447.1 hypothetical protein [Deltaproteobacteria bacterium]
MTPSNFSIMLGISILLWLPLATADADELATPADLAELASREQQLRAEVDERLRLSVVAVTEDEGQILSARITELLRQQTLRVARQGGSPPPAKRALTDDHAMTRVQRAGDTVCARVGHTLECVLQDLAYR